MSTLDIGRLDDLVEGAGTCIDAGEDQVAVFRIGDDVFAVADRCSHAEASLSEGEVFDTEVECPRHGAAFDVTTGEALTLPATKPVATYPVDIIDGEVQITIGGTDT